MNGFSVRFGRSKCRSTGQFKVVNTKFEALSTMFGALSTKLEGWSLRRMS